MLIEEGKGLYSKLIGSKGAAMKDLFLSVRISFFLK